MESRLYICPRYGKSVKSTNGLIRHVNACKILVTLPNCLPSTPVLILEYNTTNHSDLLSGYFKEDISSGTSNNDKEEIRFADTIGNDYENGKSADRDDQKPTTSNWTPRNSLLSESSRIFREVTFGESEFPISTLLFDIRYVHPGSGSSNLFHPFNDQLDYALAHYFAKSEIIKRNIDKILSNLLMKPITKKLSYCNTNEWIEKLSVIA